MINFKVKPEWLEACKFLLDKELDGYQEPLAIYNYRPPKDLKEFTERCTNVFRLKQAVDHALYMYEFENGSKKK